MVAKPRLSKLIMGTISYHGGAPIFAFPIGLILVQAVYFISLRQNYRKFWQNLRSARYLEVRVKQLTLSADGSSMVDFRWQHGDSQEDESQLVASRARALRYYIDSKHFLILEPNGK